MVQRRWQHCGGDCGSGAAQTAGAPRRRPCRPIARTWHHKQAQKHIFESALDLESSFRSLRLTPVGTLLLFSLARRFSNSSSSASARTTQQRLGTFIRRAPRPRNTGPVGCNRGALTGSGIVASSLEPRQTARCSARAASQPLRALHLCSVRVLWARPHLAKAGRTRPNLPELSAEHSAAEPSGCPADVTDGALSKTGAPCAFSWTHGPFNSPRGSRAALFPVRLKVCHPAFPGELKRLSSVQTAATPPARAGFSEPVDQAQPCRTQLCGTLTQMGTARAPAAGVVHPILSAAAQPCLPLI